MTEAIARLAEVTKALLRAKSAALDLPLAIVDTIRPLAPIRPATLPVVSLLESALDRTNTETRPLVRAILDAAPDLAWRQSYREEDGFDRRFLDTYGWFDLAGPDGPYQADGIRIMFGYWGPGLHYPNHSHPPEEHYLVLGGSAWFRLADDPYRRLGPGEVFHTPAGAVHSADMRDEGLLAMSIWRAEDLRVRIHLTGRDRDVRVD